MEAHFGRDTETLERTGTDLSHLFCSPCVAKAPQGLFLTRCDNATTRWDKEVERGGTGKPTAEVGHIEVGQASQPEGADVEVGQASQDHNSVGEMCRPRLGPFEWSRLDAAQDRDY